MIRKTMRIGDVRTSIKLEAEFWQYLREVADSRRMRTSALVNEIARATPERTNLASTLRTWSLVHASQRARNLQGELERLSIGGGGEDLMNVLDACPLPCLVLDAERSIRQLNRAFALWLNLDPKATVGLKIENMMILRGQGLRDMWKTLSEGQSPKGTFSATYVSPGKVRTAQATAVSLGRSEGAVRGSIILFETLAART